MNFALHAAGWLEGGLVADYAKLVLDADQLTMICLLYTSDAADE